MCKAECHGGFSVKNGQRFVRQALKNKEGEQLRRKKSSSCELLSTGVTHCNGQWDALSLLELSELPELEEAGLELLELDSLGALEDDAPALDSLEEPEVLDELDDLL